jgi:hypothetical protein
MRGSTIIRRRLQDITEGLGTRYTMRPPPWPPWLWKQMIKYKLNSIRALGVQAAAEPHHWKRLHWDPVLQGQLNINCFAYAVGLSESRHYSKAAIPHARWGRQRCYASSEFIEWLEKFQTYERKSARIGDVVIYYDSTGRPRHAGQVIGHRRVRSKWGTLPALFEHELWQVPMNYGTLIKYVETVPLRTAEAAFVSYWSTH